MKRGSLNPGVVVWKTPSTHHKSRRALVLKGTARLMQVDQVRSLADMILMSQGKIIWLVGKDSIGPVHPVYNLLPLDTTEFTATTKGADKVEITIRATALLIIGQDQYLLVNEEVHTFYIVK